jgi:hypothetical protein
MNAISPHIALKCQILVSRKPPNAAISHDSCTGL